MKLTSADFKQALIGIAIAGGGGLYWYWKRKKNGASSNTTAATNNASASNGMAGAIAPAPSLNTYNVFVGSQSANVGSKTGLKSNIGSSHTSGLRGASDLLATSSYGQTFSLPMS